MYPGEPRRSVWRMPKRLTISGEIDGSDMALTSPGDTADLVTAKRHDALGAAK